MPPTNWPGSRSSPKPPRLGFAVAFGLLLGARPALAQPSCATPGKDGPGGTLAGVVNTYYPALPGIVAAGSTSIPLGAAVGASQPISSGDLVLVIQMQDAAIDSTNTGSYGDGIAGDPARGSTSLNSAGFYEYAAATGAVPLSGGSLALQGAGAGGGLLNTYTSADATATQGQRRFQVVRVPQYTTATLGSSLTALNWSGTAGGVLAIDVSGALDLGSATVSLLGLGFRGGGGLQLTGGAGGSNTDYRTLSTSPFNGAKGEGIAGTPAWILDPTTNTVVNTGGEGYPNGSMARGAPGNAGGGGTDGNPSANDQNSGGGGGGNGGIGGQGGNTWNSNLTVGGFGGDQFPASAAQVILGGGGGAGTRNNSTGVAASGGAGGGIALFRAQSVSGAGTIIVDGAAGTDSDNDGGGGGGAGGSVVFTTVSGSLASLTVSANGGVGGSSWAHQGPGTCPDAAACNFHGPGGGGGGGVVLLSSPANVTVTGVAGGTSGTTTTAQDPFGATGGTNGTLATNLTPDEIPGIPSGSQCPPTPTPTSTVTPTATPPTVTPTATAPAATPTPTPPAVSGSTAIPALSPAGLALFAAILALAGLRALRRP